MRATRTPRSIQRPVQLERNGPRIARRSHMQTIHVLCDDAEICVAERGGGERMVRGVRRAAVHDGAPPPVPLPDETRVTCERVWRGQILRAILAPQTARTTKGRNTRLCAHAGAGEYDNVVRAPEQ